MPWHYPHLFQDWHVLSLYNSSTYEYWTAMNTSICSAQEWAQAEFALTDLGDRRRTKRLTHVASVLAECPSGTLPESFPEWKELKAAYRLFDNDNVTYDGLMNPHLRRTAELCRQPGEYLLIEDGSCL